MSLQSRRLFAILVASSAVILPLKAHAETILGALAKAYQFNSELNSARAGVRVTDEDVAIAKSGYRPTIAGTASPTYVTQEGTRIATFSFGVQINQTLFDGLQTRNNIRAAESRVFASNESLRNTEQNILFSAASAYMDVIRDRQIAALTSRNLEFLSEQVRAARSRFDVGEGTRTDVAQADASRAAALAQVSSARAQVSISEATYRQVVGEDPKQLQAAGPQSKRLPKSIDRAYAVAGEDHPAIRATEYLVDASAYTVKSAEGALLPQITANAGLSQQIQRTAGLQAGGISVPTSTDSDGTAQFGATLTVPIYQGGRVSARVRQSKESLGQARIEVDVRRDQVRANVASAWSQYVAAVQSVSANRQLVSAAQLALNGVVEERNVGQRTTLDVLNAQADVINAQITLVGVERDVVVASYAILSSMGSLTAEGLDLKVAVYHPQEHYQAVKDNWGGLRTPDGR